MRMAFRATGRFWAVTITTALALASAWACSGGADTGVSCLRLTCPTGFEADQAACTCKPLVTTSPSNDGGATESGAVDAGCGPCERGLACNLKGVCEASPGGGAIRTDLVNKEMSIGINNNGDGPPQGIREAHLDFNWQVSDTNAIVAVAVPPSRITIDGSDTSPSEWAGVPVSKLAGMVRSSTLLPVGRRTNGTATNLTTEDHGVSTISVAAAYDGSSIYFRVEWEDATKNDERGRWVWNGAWVKDTAETQPLAEGNLAASRATTASEDKLSLLFNINIPGFFGDNGGLGAGCASLCHLEGKNGSRVANATATDAGTTFYTGSGIMFTNAAAQKVDVWQWKARLNPLRVFDDQVIDESSRHGDGSQSEDLSYTNGTCTRRSVDGARYPAVSTNAQFYFANEWFDDTVAGCPSLGPSRAPSPYASHVKVMAEDQSPLVGKSGATATTLNVAGATPTAGDTLPGWVYRTNASTSACGRCGGEAEGRWADGKWIVELRRSLVAPDIDDVDFTTDQR